MKFRKSGILRMKDTRIFKISIKDISRSLADSGSRIGLILAFLGPRFGQILAFSGSGISQSPGEWFVPIGTNHQPGWQVRLGGFFSQDLLARLKNYSVSCELNDIYQPKTNIKRQTH